MLCASVFAALPARAADEATEACLAAHTDGQRARRAGRLLDAKRAFLKCAEASCPDLVKQQCVPWLADVEQRIPSVVFDVRDDRGQDLTSVRVSLDGKSLTDRLDGRAIPLDPGDHRFRFEAGGLRATEHSVVLREGERGRVLHVELASTRAPAPRATRPQARGIPWTSYALGGVALAAFAGGTYFFFAGKSDISDMRSSCAPGCSESEVDSARAKIRTADVLLGVGVVALGAAAVIAITHSSSNGRSESARVSKARGARWSSF